MLAEARREPGITLTPVSVHGVAGWALQGERPEVVKTVMSVHGGWHSLWFWHAVTPRLQEPVMTVDLPSCGDSCGSPRRDMHEDAATIARVLDAGDDAVACKTIPSARATIRRMRQVANQATELFLNEDKNNSAEVQPQAEPSIVRRASSVAHFPFDGQTVTFSAPLLVRDGPAGWHGDRKAGGAA